MRGKILKRIPALILAAALAGSGAALGEAPAGEKAVRPPVESALSADGLSYDDGSISVRIEEAEAHDTKIYWVSVKISDPCQLGTALAGPKGTDKTLNPMAMAKRANAVLALNGDFFSGHGSGVVYRGGQLLRDVPAYTRDELMIDEKGDLTILAVPPSTGQGRIREGIAAYQADHQIREAFCFGPGLIADGEVQKFNYTEKTSCGYPTRAQRMIFCQTGPLEYLFLATEGPEQNEPGLTVPECVELLTERGGVLQAYNLDGGNSTAIVLCGEKINARDSKPRDIADMIVFTSLADQAAQP
jgi:exopolysaccharide biosynthesis protein